MNGNIDKPVMEEGSVSEPGMGNKNGAPVKKNKNNNDYVIGNGDLSYSPESDSKYVSIVDVSFTSPQFHSALEESLHQSIQVNSPVRVNGDTSSVNVDGEIRVNLDVSSINVSDISPIRDEKTVNHSVIVVDSPVNGHLVSRVSVNGGFENFDNSLDVSDKSGHNINPSFSNVSSSYVDLVQHETDSFLLSPIMNEKPCDAGSGPSASTPIPKQKINGTPLPSLSNEILNKAIVQNGSLSMLEESLNDLALSGEDIETLVREKLKRQRSGSSDYWIQDDCEDHSIVDYLGKSTDDAEARLAAKRQARAEAREIRMRELERLQRESEDGDRVYDIYSTPDGVNRSARASSVTTPRSLLSSNNSYHSSRRSSEDSLEEVNSIRDVRMELKEWEDKFRKAMVANAQLDNEKAALAYQVDLFKDKYEELEEQHLQLTREHKDTSRQLDQTKRHRTKLQEDLDISRSQLEELLQLIQEKGLVVVEGEEEEDEEGEDKEPRTKPPKKALVSAEVADVLQHGSGSLDVRLKRFVEERNELLDELRRVKLELEEERASRGRHANGPTDDQDDMQREANKLLGDYKFKLQKAEQDVNTLQATVARLESQVVRYKSAAETSEKLEDELKLEKRKLQRELRETQARLEELETSHSHLQRRLDKLKNAKSALLKDL